MLGELKVEDIWGIGRRTDPRLERLGIRTAKELRDSDPKHIRKSLSVVGKKIVLELRGIPCFKLEDEFKARKNIVCSRSFGKNVTELAELEEATADYAAKACQKMRG